ncbi:hypothetical protein SNEBB_007827 [Seison nebaliae]|nr:hypothetical protein SNEBB_007827 [Seison nebaliae]
MTESPISQSTTNVLSLPHESCDCCDACCPLCCGGQCKKLGRLIVVQYLCCCGPRSCGLAIPFPPIKESTSTRLMFCFFNVSFWILCAFFMYSPAGLHIFKNFAVSGRLQCAESAGCIIREGEEEGYFDAQASYLDVDGSTVRVLLGTEAVYRSMMAIIAFFTFFSLVTIRIKNSHCVRAHLHNGFWILKAMALVILWHVFVINLVFPEEILVIWMYIGMVGAIILIFYDISLLVRSAHLLNEKLVVNEARHGKLGKFAHFLKYFLPFFLYIISLGAFLYLVITFGMICKILFILIVITGIISLIILIIVLMINYYKKTLRSSGLQVSMILTYVMYQLAIALVSVPYKTVLDNRKGNFSDETISVYTTIVENNLYFNTSKALGVLDLGILSTCDIEGGTFKARLAKLAGVKNVKIYLPKISIALSLIFLYISSFRMVRPKSVRPENITNPHDSVNRIHPSEKYGVGQRVIQNDYDIVSYQYWRFHIIQILTSFFMMMQLTNWDNPNYTDINRFGVSETIAWIKISAVWFCQFYYICTVIQPFVTKEGYYKDLKNNIVEQYMKLSSRTRTKSKSDEAGRSNFAIPDTLSQSAVSYV